MFKACRCLARTSKMKGASSMGSRALENRIKRLKEIEAAQKELEKQADAIKAEIKAEMEARGADELHTGNFIIRWKSVISNKFDSKAFQAEHGRLYEQYLKQTASRRFTVA